MNKVLVVGNSLALGRTEEVYARGFTGHGCQVRTCVLEEASGSQRRGLFARLAWRLAEPMMLRPFNRRLLETARAFAPDLIFVVAPRLVQPQTLARLQSLAPAFAFFTDNPLDDHHTHRSGWQDKTLLRWDACLIWSKTLAARLREKGARRAEYHAFCCDTQYLFPQPAATPAFDVVFLGNWDPGGKREAYLSAIRDFRLGIWGTRDWLRRSTIDVSPYYQGMNRYQDLPRLLGSGKTALNLMRPQNELGHNLRTYEIIACGVPMLSERTPELPLLFPEGEEAVYFSSPEEMRSQVEWVLSHAEEAQRMAARALEKRTAHSVAARIGEIAQLLSQIQAAAGRG